MGYSYNDSFCFFTTENLFVQLFSFVRITFSWINKITSFRFNILWKKKENHIPQIEVEWEEKKKKKSSNIWLFHWIRDFGLEAFYWQYSITDPFFIHWISATTRIVYWRRKCIESQILFENVVQEEKMQSNFQFPCIVFLLGTFHWFGPSLFFFHCLHMHNWAWGREKKKENTEWFTKKFIIVFISGLRTWI